MGDAAKRPGPPALERKDSDELRLERMKAASLDIYRNGISIKLAARKHEVGYADLKYYYENEAHEVLPLHDDDDEGDYEDM